MLEGLNLKLLPVIVNDFTTVAGGGGGGVEGGIVAGGGVAEGGGVEPIGGETGLVEVEVAGGEFSDVLVEDGGTFTPFPAVSTFSFSTSTSGLNTKKAPVPATIKIATIPSSQNLPMVAICYSA